MKVFVAVNKAVAVAHYFDSEDAVTRLITMDGSAWVRSGDFTIEGTVHGLLVKDDKWVEGFYGF